MTTFNNNNEYISGWKSFEYVKNKKDVDVFGTATNNDHLVLSDLRQKDNESVDNMDIQYYGYGGTDTLSYYETSKGVTMRVADNGFEFYLTGGQGNGEHSDKSDQLNSLEVWTSGVEVFYLANNRGNNVDIRNTSLSNIQIHGGNDLDLLHGSNQADIFYGNGQNDTIYGHGGNDFLDGGDRDDRIYGGVGADTLVGGAGMDLIYGEGEDDRISGGSEADTIDGGLGQDEIRGDSGEDVINGGLGNDTISGGEGNDRLTGGGFDFDSDRFEFALGDGHDIITDLSTEDEIFIEWIAGANVSVSNANGHTYLSYAGSVIQLEFMSYDRNDFSFVDSGSGVTITLTPQPTGGGGDTVICTYIFERGYIPAEVYQWDGVYGQRLGSEVLTGYHAWAIPLVENVLKRSEIATQLVRPLACAWAQEMAHRCDPANHPKGSRLGVAILAVGVPLCRLIARMTKNAPSAASL